jgi:alkylhydroperoxidase family enzyme
MGRFPGEPLNIFKTMVNHSELMKRWLVFANHILGKSTLPERERELIILRIGFLCRSGYEWGQHVLIARRAKITDEEIRRIKVGPKAAGWSEVDRLLLAATDELHADAHVSDATWQGLAGHFNTQQLMDIVFTVGQYNLVSMALNSFGVQADPGLPGFDI